jgi:predicted 2-oxoglutarate/Fe(II)-dependent dioxygenase YbiX/peroxiredoxin
MAILVGDSAPLFEARTGGTPNFPFHAVAGRPIVLSFLGSLHNPIAAQSVRRSLERYRPWFDDKQACFFGVSTDASDEQQGLLRDEMPGVRFIRDFDIKVSRLYGVAPAAASGQGTYEATTFVLDTMLRVAAAIPIEDVDRYDALLDEAIARVKMQSHGYGAPVLVMPDVFEKELCEELILLHHVQGGRSSGVMRDVADQTVETEDARYKKRRDVMVKDAQMQIRLRDLIGRRLVPAILQCFQFRVTHLERYLVGCYDAAESGFFSAHRDNVTRGTAHRRVAVSVHLNDDYAGGEMVFPEFGSTTFKGGTGSAIIFSCSIMHEVLPVRRGTRFAFLPFLQDDAAEQVRQQNHRYIISND